MDTCWRTDASVDGEMDARIQETGKDPWMRGGWMGTGMTGRVDGRVRVSRWQVQARTRALMHGRYMLTAGWLRGGRVVG